MKHLYLIRHAKSSWAEDGLGDHDRPLNPRGREQLGPMGKAIRAEGALKRAVYCSSAIRARQTLEGIVLADRPLALHIEDVLYTFDFKVLIGWLRDRGDEDHITLVGHNPALEETANYLLKTVPERFPTCAFMHLSLPLLKHWHELARHTGRLEKFLTPRDVSYKLFKATRQAARPGQNAPLTHVIPEALHRLCQDMRDLEPGMIHGYDNQFLHRYRITMRRSRAIAEALCDICEDTDLRQALRTLRKHARATSYLRDIHVLLAHLEPGLPTTAACPAATAAALKSHLAHLRETEHKRLVKRISGRKYRKDMKDLQKLITSRAFGKMARKLTPGDIRQALDKHLRRYSTLAQALNRQSPDDDVHAIRKLLKRIRYLAEMDNTISREMLKQLKQHQHLFGKLQDLRVQIDVLDHIGHTIATEPSDPREALEGLIAGLRVRKQKVLEKILAQGVLPPCQGKSS